VKRLLALLALTALTLPASAQTYPQPGEGDPRIQTVQYDPAQIIRLSVAPGLQTLVELSPGENIQTIGVGDSAAWAVSAGKRGDFFFVKNVSADAMTNMSVVTAARIYNFELSPSSGYGDIDAYHLKIVSSLQPQADVTVNIGSNFEYRLSGSKAIRPSSVYQEGTRTILQWPEAAEIPGIFLKANGNEALVNGEMQDGRFVIAGTPEKLIFRLDQKTAYATRKKQKAVSGE
jgi:type IV secretion system protein VirB9